MRPLLVTIEDKTIQKALVLLAIPIKDRMNTGWSQTSRWYTRSDLTRNDHKRIGDGEA